MPRANHRVPNNRLHDIFAPLKIMRRGVRCQMKLLSTLFLITLLNGCTSSHPYEKDCPELVNLTESQVVHKFGPPDNIATNTVKEYAETPWPDTWTALVVNVCPTNIPGNLNQPIRQLSWIQGRSVRTAWLNYSGGTWIVIGAYKRTLGPSR